LPHPERFMRLYNTSGLTESVIRGLDPDTASHIYNGLDCCLTFEIYEELIRELEDEPQNVKDVYQFALDKSAPFFEMSLRGIRVDQAALRETISEFRTKLRALESRFHRLTSSI